jgi:hypothetical protein
VPVLPEAASVDRIDRLQGPYTPDNPQYLERDISWAAFGDRLTAMGL